MHKFQATAEVLAYWGSGQAEVSDQIILTWSSIVKLDDNNQISAKLLSIQINREGLAEWIDRHRLRLLLDYLCKNLGPKLKKKFVKQFC